MQFQTAVRNHLSAYKHRVLGIVDPGIFVYRGQQVYHDHILPVGQRDENLLPAARKIWPALQQRCPEMKRHRYFHHLNSSQALAINLFAPFFEQSPDVAAGLLTALTTPGRLNRWEPEWVPNRSENTNFDAAWWLSDGTAVLCEVKYTESGFGKTKADIEHLGKLDKTYAGPLGDIILPKALEPISFCKNYQLLRNIWHLVQDENRRLIVLLPRANSKLWREWEKLAPMVKPSVRDRIALVALEDVVERLEAQQSLSVPLKAHVKAFREKYLPEG